MDESRAAALSDVLYCHRCSVTHHPVVGLMCTMCRSSSPVGVSGDKDKHCQWAVSQIDMQYIYLLWAYKALLPPCQVLSTKQCRQLTQPSLRCWFLLLDCTLYTCKVNSAREFLEPGGLLKVNICPCIPLITHIWTDAKPCWRLGAVEVTVDWFSVNLIRLERNRICKVIASYKK